MPAPESIKVRIHLEHSWQEECGPPLSKWEKRAKEEIYNYPQTTRITATALDDDDREEEVTIGHVHYEILEIGLAFEAGLLCQEMDRTQEICNIAQQLLNPHWEDWNKKTDISKDLPLHMASLVHIERIELIADARGKGIGIAALDTILQNYGSEHIAVLCAAGSQHGRQKRDPLYRWHELTPKKTESKRKLIENYKKAGFQQIGKSRICFKSLEPERPRTYLPRNTKLPSSLFPG